MSHLKSKKSTQFSICFNRTKLSLKPRHCQEQEPQPTVRRQSRLGNSQQEISDLKVPYLWALALAGGALAGGAGARRAGIRHDGGFGLESLGFDWVVVVRCDVWTV